MSSQQDEILQRLIRMESRMVQLGDHVGANLRTKQRIEIHACSAGVAVEVDSMDVSISRIVNELKNAHHKACTVQVWCGPEWVADIRLS